MYTPSLQGERLRGQQLSMVFGQTARNYAISPAMGALVSVALWPSADHQLLGGWMLVLLVVSLWRLALTRSYFGASASDRSSHLWEVRFVLSLALTCACWGIGGCLLIRGESVAHQAFMYFFLLGIAAGTSAVYAAHGPSVTTGISLTLVPTTAISLASGNTLLITMGIGSAIFGFAASRGATLMNDATRSFIRLSCELEQIARTDPLSGLNNRRAFTELGDLAIATANRSTRPCSLIMIDVDHFKLINDQFGHAGGDAVIRALGAALAKSVRLGEYVGRIGGEEFAVLLPDAPLEQAEVAAYRISTLVRSMRVAFQDASIVVSVSMGLAASGSTTGSFEELTRRADLALYAAKRNGRDRIEIAGQL